MKLKSFKVNHGGRFNPETITGPVIIFDGNNMVGAKADQECGKSTFLDLFIMNCGQLGGDKVVEQLKNSESGLIDTELEFEEGRKSYHVKNKNGTLTIRREGEKVPGGPQQLLKSMLGVVGISPMEVKDAPIEKIVKWLASYSTKSAEEFEKDMLKIKNGIKVAKKTRAEANKSLKGLNEYLMLEPMYQDWDKSEKEYGKPIDLQKLSAELKTAGDKSDKLLEAETKLDSLKKQRTQIEEQIKALQENLNSVNDRIATGEGFVKTNADARKKYDEVKKRYDAAASDAINHNKWKEIKQKEEERVQFEKISQKADATEKDLVKQQQELQWEVIPDIKGVEIILEDTHEDEGEQRKAGFYYNGFSSSQMSKSEWIGVVLQILKKNKVKVLVLDEISDFGSKLRGILQKLAESGCYILYTQMALGVDEIEIEYQ